MSTMKYTALNTTEKLALDSEGLIKAATLEAIDRGIAPPTRLSDALNLKDAKGWWMPADATKVYELVAKNRSYSNADGTGIAFLTEEAARNALTGAFSVVCDGFDNNKRYKLSCPFESFEIRSTHIVNVPQKGYWTKLKEYDESTDAFDAVLEECRADLEQLRQEEYNRAVLQEQRKTYMDLANGDESIARAFWSKTKHTPFPETQP